jgi:hypothetical protein
MIFFIRDQVPYLYLKGKSLNEDLIKKIIKSLRIQIWKHNTTKSSNLYL